MSIRLIHRFSFYWDQKNPESSVRSHQQLGGHMSIPNLTQHHQINSQSICKPEEWGILSWDKGMMTQNEMLAQTPRNEVF